MPRTTPLRRPLLPRVPLALALRRRPRARRALVLALAVGVALLVHGTVADAEAVRAAWGATRPVLVAVRDLPPGHVLEPDDVRAERRPAAVVPAGALTSAAALDGGTVRSLVLEGDVLVRRRLAPTGADGLAGLLPRGTRGVSVPVEPATAPPLRAGQLVDLVAVGADEAGRPGAVVVAADAPVVHVGDHAVTVAVEPEVVAAVAAALAAGSVTVALSP